MAEVCFAYMKPEYIAVGLVTLILTVYTAVAFAGVLPGFILLTFSLSPLLVIWMVWVVLKHGTFNGRELKGDEEYGYSDLKK